MWQGIHGHDDVAERFRQSLQHGRLASSYLFLGPNGIGKRAFALKLAQTLLCQTHDSAELVACGQCESCQLAMAGNHPDLDIVGLPAGKRRMPVELFLGDREHRNQEGLCHNVALRPRLGKRRLAIIDDADHLTVESSNCLLKTLEEPPPGAVLILLATSRSRLLPTILSRTQVVRFESLPTEALELLLTEQGVTADTQQARQLASHSHGSLAVARELADPQWWELQQWIIPRLSPARIDCMQLVSRINDFVAQSDKTAEARRQRLRTVFQMVGNHFREVLRLSCQTLPSGSTADSQAANLLEELGVQASPCAISALDRCLEAETELDRNANQATLLECWLDDLAGILSSAEPTARA